MHQHSLMVPKTMASDDPGPSGQKPNIVWLLSVRLCVRSSLLASCCAI
jgi:hypothetical protein